ncbi:MAG: thioredoxin [Muribaculaceae bacterium]|nr:thioredoxin [Muribaculaceae bacterium]
MNKFQELINSDTPVLVDFYATWCGPCKMMHPVLEELAPKVKDKAHVIKVDIDKNEALAALYNVRSVPTFIIFRNGEIKWRAAGIQSLTELEKQIAEAAQ